MGWCCRGTTMTPAIAINTINEKWTIPMKKIRVEWIGRAMMMDTN